MNNGYLYTNYSRMNNCYLLFVREVNFKKISSLSKYYYCACSEYLCTDRIHTTEYI